eukprot:Nk52_evm56s352 gene=Nk52_evmTU56s352
MKDILKLLLVVLCAASASCFTLNRGVTKLPSTGSHVHYVGRVLKYNGVTHMDWPCVSASMILSNLKTASVHMNGGNNKFRVYITSEGVNDLYDFSTDTQLTVYPIDYSFDKSKVYTLKFQKLNEASYFLSKILKYPRQVSIHSFDFNSDVKIHPWKSSETRKIEVFGDSDSNGFGILGKSGSFIDTFVCAVENQIHNQDCGKGWPIAMAKELNAEVAIEAWSGKGVVQNAIPGFIKKYHRLLTDLFNFDYAFNAKTMPELWNRTLAVNPAHYKQNIPAELNVYDFANNVPDLVMILLGSNDYYFKHPDNTTFVNGYKMLIEKIIQSYKPTEGKKPISIITLCGGVTQDEYSPCPFVEQATTSFASKIGSKDLRTIKYINIPGSPGLSSAGCEKHRNVKAQDNLAKYLLPKVQAIMNW